MAMPEAAMNKQSDSVARKENVWTSGQVFPVKSESETATVKRGPDSKFRARIAATNLRHVYASFTASQRVHDN